MKNLFLRQWVGNPTRLAFVESFKILLDYSLCCMLDIYVTTWAWFHEHLMRPPLTTVIMYKLLHKKWSFTTNFFSNDPQVVPNNHFSETTFWVITNVIKSFNVSDNNFVVVNIVVEIFFLTWKVLATIFSLLAMTMLSLITDVINDHNSRR
jgi:hypothetical protein